MYPREINEKRKELYPHYKCGGQQGMKAVINDDRLYINNMHENNNPMDT